MINVQMVTIHDFPRIAKELSGQTIALDFETTGINVRRHNPVALQLGTAECVYILDCRKYNKERDFALWHHNIALLIEAVATIVGQNIGFDFIVMLHFFGVVMSNMVDTMLQELIIHGEGHSSAQKHGLGTSMLAMGERYGLAVSKEEVKWFVDLHLRPKEWEAPFPPAQIAYMIQDIVTPLAIEGKQRELLATLGLKNTAFLENATIGPLAKVGYVGVKLDRDKWSKALDIMEKSIEDLREEIVEELSSYIDVSVALHKYQRRIEEIRHNRTMRVRYEKESKHLFKEQGYTWGDYKEAVMSDYDKEFPCPKNLKLPPEEFNLNSTSQLLNALQRLGLDIDNTQKTTLEKHIDDYEVVAKILSYKQHKKMTTSFGKGLLDLIDVDGRIHPHYLQIGAQTGRMSCTEPNFQQLPKKSKAEVTLRQCIVAEEGKQLLTCDFSCIEMRVLADFCKDKGMLKIFEDGGDLHCCTTRMMFEIDAPDHKLKGEALEDKDGNILEEAQPALEWIPGLKYRDCAKTIGFGLVYGMSAIGLKNKLKIDEDIAKELMQTYFDTFERIKEWMDDMVEEALDNGYAETKIGRKRFYDLSHELAEKMGISFRKLKGYLSRQAKNSPIQGTSADITKHALILMDSYIPSEAHIIAIVHDEFVVECPDNRVEECSIAMRQAMYEAARYHLPTVALPPMEEASQVYVCSHWFKP